MTYEHQSLTEDGKFSPYSGTGVSPAILSNRISYTYNMQGPSMTVDTACSSSLVAIDLGCKALMAGDCLQAVVLGVNFLGGHGYEGECAANMLSVNGRCATFSDKADGYARGEGCCGMIIKKLQHALEDDDRVIAVIKSTSVNQDGKSANLTSPNGPSQEKCIQQALTRADLTVDDIDFIEAHGTGTPLGDPMEIQALANVFDERQLPLPITAIKAHFGHTEGAAGMIGVIKAIKCMQKRKIPKNIHCNTLNSRIVPFVENKKIIIINQDGYELQQNKSVYYAGISSFGFGGTNAHIIIGLRK
jgi:acyl transferase domain-containing protein